jgi:haloalkane dehalogenase
MPATLQWKTSYPFTSRFKNIHGFRMHYVEEGEGRPVVMLHGNPTWSFFYRNLIRELSRKYRVIAPDHIGCGLSEKPGENHYDYTLETRITDFESLIAGLGIDRNLTLIIHDWGGAVGIGYALRHPETVSGIVVMNTAAFFPPHQKGLPPGLALLRKWPSLSGFLIQHLNLFVRGALMIAARKPLSRPVRQGLTAPYDTPANRVATHRFVQDIPVTPADRAWKTIDWMDQNLSLLTHIPLLILWGLRDPVFDPDYFLEWKRRFPDAETHRFPEAGHYLLEDAGDLVLPRILNFLKRIPM